MRWLHFRLDAPMASFGDATIDAHGTTGDFPTQSMLTGLFANALGWTRSMHDEHQALQDRLVYGALHRYEPVLGRMTDYQTANLGKEDKAWTTRGQPAGRAGGPRSYAGAHQRWRDYHADARVSGVVRLKRAERPPTIDDIARALQFPVRPLFVGRKSCLPTSNLFAGWIEDAPDARSALCMIAPADTMPVRALWPQAESVVSATRTIFVTDERNWMTGLHGGGRLVCLGELTEPGDSR